jgi:hypothetical protein
MMQRLLKVSRSILAVLAGILAMTALAFAIEMPLRLLTLRLFAESFPEPAMLDSSVVWMLSQSLYTVPALILGGYVAARLAPCCSLAHAIGMAIVQELLIVALVFNPPHPVPSWAWAMTLLLTPAAIIFGGYLRSR